MHNTEVPGMQIELQISALCIAGHGPGTPAESWRVQELGHIEGGFLFNLCFPPAVTALASAFCTCIAYF